MSFSYIHKNTYTWGGGGGGGQGGKEGTVGYKWFCVTVSNTNYMNAKDSKKLQILCNVYFN